MDCEITKMGENIGKPFIFGDGVEGNKLPVYQMGGGTEGRYRGSRITKASEVSDV